MSINRPTPEQLAEWRYRASRYLALGEQDNPAFEAVDRMGAEIDALTAEIDALEAAAKDCSLAYNQALWSLEQAEAERDAMVEQLREALVRVNDMLYSENIHWTFVDEALAATGVSRDLD